MKTGIGLDKLLGATPRLTQIVGVLAKHGFVHTLHGEHAWPPPAEVRQAFEEFGVVFLKLGQVLALRRDLLPDAYAAELERLHDRLPEMPFEAVRTTIESEFKASLERLFCSFAEVPLAAATIAQVRAATLEAGREVVVKVRRDGLDAIIAEDIAALSYLAAVAETLMPSLRAIDARGLVRQLDDSLRRETDFRIEARTLQRFGAIVADAEGVWIPSAVLERTTAAVLTMDHSPGSRLDAYTGEHPEAGPKLARELGAFMLQSVFIHGLFHADPHPGNIFVLADGRLCFHDFGMVGELDERTRESLMRLIEAIVGDDVRALTEAYLEIVTALGDVDQPSLERSLNGLLREIRERADRQVSIGDALQSLVRIGGAHGLRNPDSFLFLTRALLITEAVMQPLDPSSNLLDLARRELPRLMATRYSPSRLLEEVRRVLHQLERLLQEGPADARRALRRVAEGDLGHVHAPGLEALGQRLSRDLQRLTGALASAALVVAGSLLVPRPGWHGWLGDGMVAIGLAGTFVVAFGALFKRLPR